ncbi:unnamed protein product [Ixodes pacificus]
MKFAELVLNFTWNSKDNNFADHQTIWKRASFNLG